MYVKNACKVGCIGCKMCARVYPEAFVIENKKDNLNTPYLEVIVTDSVYVDISSVDDKIISALYTNAVNQGFENIEMDG